MKTKIILGVFMILLATACLQQSSKTKQHSDDERNQLQALKSGVRIENKINRGLAFTDSLGDKYAITYIPIAITNTNSIPIHFDLNFSSEYDHPLEESDEKFRLVLMPEEWTPDPMTITDSMIKQIPRYAKTTTFKKTLLPEEKAEFAIGTLRPSPAKICGIIPNFFFIKDLNKNFPDCQWQKDQPNNAQIKLGLKLDYCHVNGSATNCTIVSCGTISYHKNK